MKQKDACKPNDGITWRKGRFLEEKSIDGWQWPGHVWLGNSPTMSSGKVWEML